MYELYKTSLIHMKFLKKLKAQKQSHSYLILRPLLAICTLNLCFCALHLYLDCITINSAHKKQLKSSFKKFSSHITSVN